MTAREDILTKVRHRLPVASELPNLSDSWTRYEDPISQFSAVLGSVGGRCISVENTAAAQRELSSVPKYATARQRVSVVPGVGESTIDLRGIDDPHQLAEVDFAVLPGELAVAENAAIWVATDDLLVRTLYFLTQHLAIVVPAAQLVCNMHEAYARIDVTRCRFGTFLSGPSKTADIEQSLVIGAHGARSLTVLLAGQLNG
jgi:L-lactate dehydrogenase complex protein LldG